ncbi:MAG: CAAX amino terminal protease self- immunity [Bacteroidetes bacterium ADurb.BinA261]|jgi:membrane protease YdiL (CAAX protease family)|nr:MAG: CAAX amino terminal protease self- immunity [Bacteroidetes bacterium ADurb.BinA261]
MTNKILLAFRKSNLAVSILYLFILFLVFYIVWTPVYYYFLEKYDILFSPTPNETIMTAGLGQQILAIVILAPLIETLIFQKWVYQALSLFGWLKRYKILIIFLSAVIFGSIHFYSLSYAIYNFFAGALLMLAYIIKIDKNPYWTVVLLHGLMNLFSIVIDPIEKTIFNVM